LDENHLSLYVLDVSGHGVPSAMVTVSVNQSLLPSTGLIAKKITEYPPHYYIAPPSEVLNQLDREYPLERFDKHFTMSYIILNLQTGHIQYSSAAHPSPVLVTASGKIKLLDAGGTIIGMGGVVPFEEGEERMQGGDRLYLYTDGIVEYFNEAGEKYGENRFYRDLLKYRKDPLPTTCERVVQSMTAFGGSRKAEDDITLVAIECRQVAE